MADGKRVMGLVLVAITAAAVLCAPPAAAAEPDAICIAGLFAQVNQCIKNRLNNFASECEDLVKYASSNPECLCAAVTNDTQSFLNADVLKLLRVDASQCKGVDGNVCANVVTRVLEGNANDIQREVISNPQCFCDIDHATMSLAANYVCLQNPFCKTIRSLCKGAVGKSGCPNLIKRTTACAKDLLNSDKPHLVGGGTCCSELKSNPQCHCQLSDVVTFICKVNNKC